MKLAIYAALLGGFASIGHCTCLDDEQTFMSCKIDGRAAVLRVCFDETHVHYRFGALSRAPELAINDSIGTVEYRPWNGVGRSIAEGIRFQTDGYEYDVYAGFERMFGDEEYEDIPHRSFGGVIVTRGEQEIAHLMCNRASVKFGWDDELFKAKQALGYVWDFHDRSWIELPD